MKKKTKNKKKQSLGALAAELLDGFGEIIIEILLVGFGALVAMILPDSLNARIPDWVIYIAGLLFILRGITVIHLLGSSPRTRKNESKYGKIDPEHLKRRFDLLIGLGFTKEIKEKRRYMSVTYTYENERFMCIVLDRGRIECLLGIVGEKPESLTASGVTDVSGDPTTFDREYAEASNMRRLMMINELIETDSELKNFLTV